MNYYFKRIISAYYFLFVYITTFSKVTKDFLFLTFLLGYMNKLCPCDMEYQLVYDTLSYENNQIDNFFFVCGS